MILRNCFILLIIFFIIQSKFIAQSNHLIGGSLGASDFHIKDDHGSPLIFKGMGLTPSFQYYFNGEVNKHYFEASFISDNLSSSSNNFYAENNRAKIRYSYNHAVTDFSVLNKKINIFAGASVNTFLCYTDYYYGWQNNTSATAIESWYWNNSLDISLQLMYSNSVREFFSIQLFIPLISNVSRPKFSPSADYNYEENDWKFKMFGETEFMTENFSVNTIITYHHPLFWRFNYQISYEFYFSAYKRPKDISMYMNNLRAGLFFCF